MSYNPAVRNLIGATGLRSVAQKIYFERYAPSQGVLSLEYAGSKAQFSTPTVRELRGLNYFAVGGVDEFKRLLAMIAPGDVFFDIGAQYGAYAYLVGNAAGQRVRVVAFEPFPRDYVLLAKNAELNPHANVQCINAALSDRECMLSMSAEDGGQEICPRIGAPSGNSQDVPALRGDALITAGKVPPPNVLKIDVEGHEMAVLQGLAETLARPDCRGIYCEIHDALLPEGETGAQLIEFLRSKGFTSIFECPGPNHYVFAEKSKPHRAA